MTTVTELGVSPLDYGMSGIKRIGIEDKDAPDKDHPYYFPGVVSFLDYSVGAFYPGEIYIHYMFTRPEYQQRGYAGALVQWIYDLAVREGLTVNWGKIVSDEAWAMFEKWRGQVPGTRGKMGMNRAHVGSRRTAHLGNDPEAVYHCPFCGSGALIGGPDGSVNCGVCERTYMVFIQPQFAGMPADQSPGAVDPAAASNDGAVDALPGTDAFDPDAVPVTDISQAPPFELVTTPGGTVPNATNLVAQLAERITFT